MKSVFLSMWFLLLLVFVSSAAQIPLNKLAQSGATNGQSAVWNSSTGRWEPATVGGGGASVVGAGYLPSNQTWTANNTHTGNEFFSNGLTASQVTFNDLPSMGTVFSNSLTAPVGGNGGTIYSNGFYVSGTLPTLTWFNSTNSTYSIQHSGNNDGELGWTNTAAYQYGEYFARVTCITSRGPGTIGSISLRIISTAGNVLAQVNSSNNPLGQTITCGYTGANVRGVSLLRAGTIGQTSTLDFNDLYLTNTTMPELASGILTLRGTTKIELDTPTVTPRFSNTTSLGTADLPYSNVATRVLSFNDGTSMSTAPSGSAGPYRTPSSGGTNSIVTTNINNVIYPNADSSVISGGDNNTISNMNGNGWGNIGNAIGGGLYNTIAGDYCQVIDGGFANKIDQLDAANAGRGNKIGGGNQNQIQRQTQYGVIGGGMQNIINGNNLGTIAGGRGNQLSTDGGTANTIGGGDGNIIRASSSLGNTIAGGNGGYIHSAGLGGCFIGNSWLTRMYDSNSLPYTFQCSSAAAEDSVILNSSYIFMNATFLSEVDHCQFGIMHSGLRQRAYYSTNFILSGTDSSISNASSANAFGPFINVDHSGCSVFVDSSTGTNNVYRTTTRDTMLLKFANGVCINTNRPFTVGGTNAALSVVGPLVVAGSGYFDTNSIYLGKVKLSASELQSLYTGRMLTNIFAGLSFLLLINFGRDRWRERKNKARDAEQLRRILELEKRLGVE